MQGLAAANANAATPLTTPARIEQVGTCGGAVIADHFFACEGDVPLLTVKRRGRRPAWRLSGEQLPPAADHLRLRQSDDAPHHLLRR
jgi:hypothetical protein